MRRAVIVLWLFIIVSITGWAQRGTIFHAISYETIDEVKALIENGVDVNQPRYDGALPLQIAARESDAPELFRLLLNAGAQIDPADNHADDTPFNLILAKNNIELVRLFIGAGADIHRIDKRGRTPLEHAAVHTKDTEIFRLLVREGASVTTGGSGSTPLHFAAGNFDRPQILSVLIELGADVNARDAKGFTPLMYAASFFECVDILLTAGADINAQNDEGQTALMLSARYGYYPDVITLLLQNGADANIRDNTARTALDWLDMNRQLHLHPVRREIFERM